MCVASNIPELLSYKVYNSGNTGICFSGGKVHARYTFACVLFSGGQRGLSRITSHIMSELLARHAPIQTLKFIY